MLRKTLSTLGIAALIVPLAPAALAADASEDAAPVKQEIRAALGEVPDYLQAFPEAALPGAWAEMKALQMSSETALSGKTKELISLAVAARSRATTASTTTPRPPRPRAPRSRRSGRPSPWRP